ncbi:hypothetical protein KP509_1Z092500 [Ceratopteris richardii]|nr:hypothetical protein KP509_1Z092500 [Ceratopteris richardii]
MILRILAAPHSTAQIQQPLTQRLALDAQPVMLVAAHFLEDYMNHIVDYQLHAIAPVLSKTYAPKVSLPTYVDSRHSATSAPLADVAPLMLPYAACDKLRILQPSAQHGSAEGSSLLAPFCGHAALFYAPAAFSSLDSHGQSTASIFHPLVQQLAQHARFISTSAHPNMPIVAFFLGEYIAESVDCLLQATPQAFSYLYVSTRILLDNVGSNLARTPTMAALNDNGTPTFPSASQNKNDLVTHATTHPLQQIPSSTFSWHPLPSTNLGGITPVITPVQIECCLQPTPTPMRKILPPTPASTSSCTCAACPALQLPLPDITPHFVLAQLSTLQALMPPHHLEVLPPPFCSGSSTKGYYQLMRPMAPIPLLPVVHKLIDDKGNQNSSADTTSLYATYLPESPHGEYVSPIKSSRLPKFLAQLLGEPFLHPPSIIPLIPIKNDPLRYGMVPYKAFLIPRSQSSIARVHQPHKFFTNESTVLPSPVNHPSDHTLYFIFEHTDDAITWHGHLLDIVPSIFQHPMVQNFPVHLLQHTSMCTLTFDPRISSCFFSCLAGGGGGGGGGGRG